MNQEVLFARTLEYVKKTGREQGNSISREQVEAAFEPLALDKTQMEMVYDYLEKQKIGIGEPLPEEDFLSEEEIDYLKDYQTSLQELPEATDGEKEAVTMNAMAGDKTAQSRLIEIYLPQIPEIAKLYAGQGVLLDDLIGQGNMALSEGVTMLAAMEKASEGEGMLMKMVMDAMEEMVSSTFAESKVDEKVVKKVNEVADKARELAEELRRKVTVQELAQETGMSEEKIREAYRISGYAIEDLDGGKA